MTTLFSTLLRLGRTRCRARLRCRAVVLVLAVALAKSLAAQEDTVSNRAPHLVALRSYAPAGAGGSPAGSWEGVSGPLTPHEAKLTASDGAAGDQFGRSVALSGEWAVLGAWLDDDLGSASGSAYVFERQADGTWAERAKLTASDGAEGDDFGFNVAVSGERAVVTAPLDDDLGSGSGSAYVFERQADGTWAEVAKLTASDGAAGDFLGGGSASLALSGEVAVVGAHGADDLGPDSGSAYVFERQVDGSWIETAELTASDGEGLIFFGISTAVLGEVAVVGAYQDDDLGAGSGSAYVFERQADGTWAEGAKLTASDGAAGDNFGVSVAVSGERVLVGAFEDDDLGLGSGSAYIFERQADGTWAEEAKLTASDGAAGDDFGFSLALSGDRALIGADEDDDLGLGSGSAYIFERQADGTWAERAKLTASDGVAGDDFGISLGLSPELALVGAEWDDDLGTDSGSAYVYSLKGCELNLALQSVSLRAGEDLRVEVDLHHRRPITVTVPVLFWVEDAAGQVLVRKSSPPITMQPGDHRKLRLAMTLPLDLPAGVYRVFVGVEKMHQGIARASRRVRVIE